MDKTDFVSRIKLAVNDASVTGVLAYLKSPPGRKPSDAARELSAWFNQLSQSDREAVERVVKFSVRTTTFSMLTILDGTKSIWNESESDLNKLQLTHQTPTGPVELNAEQGEYLHDLFGAVVPFLGF
jgi:hypothetical protein